MVPFLKWRIEVIYLQQLFLANAELAGLSQIFGGGWMRLRVCGLRAVGRYRRTILLELAGHASRRILAHEYSSYELGMGTENSSRSQTDLDGISRFRQRFR